MSRQAKVDREAENRERQHLAKSYSTGSVWT